MTRTPRRPAMPIARLLLLAALGLPADSNAAEFAILDGWEPRPVLSGGPRGTFRLTARVDWASDAPRDAARYAIRVTSPSGRADVHPLAPNEGPGSRRLTVYVPAVDVRNLPPEQVRVRVEVLDQTTGQASEPLEATIADFPRPNPGNPPGESGPFGFGESLDPDSAEASPLPRPGPDGLRFVRVPASGDEPGFFLSVSEASNSQVAFRLDGYDARSGRSDEFLLEGPDQPALGLSPSRAGAYLESLGRADDAGGVTFRLPTREEWLRAARAGRSSAFWWGDEPTHPEGANLLGPEPALEADTTAPALPPGRGPAFAANPWGLFHAFGNVEEWATDGDGRFVRLGGHFRTEPDDLGAEPAGVDPDEVGPDPYVGVRPAFSLTPEAGAALVKRALEGVPALAAVDVAYDPDRATATLSGRVDDLAARREVNRRLQPLWFLAAVEDAIESPTIGSGRLARVAGAAGPAERVRTFGRYEHRVPVAIRWADWLPVLGSDWYVNIYFPDGSHAAHPLLERQPGPGRRFVAAVEESALRAAGVPLDAPRALVALSLGGPAPSPSDPKLVSDPVEVAWKPAIPE